MNKLITTTGCILFVIVFTSIFTQIANVIRDPARYGIVILDGYEHGVAMCGESKEAAMDLHTQGTEYHMWVSDNILYTINYGHMDDVQVGELVALATVQCNKLK